MKQAIKITYTRTSTCAAVTQMVDKQDKQWREYIGYVVARMIGDVDVITTELVEVPNETILYQPSADSCAMGGA